MTTENKQLIKRLFLSTLGIVALVAVAYLIMYLLGWTDMSQEELQTLIASTGAWAPLAYMLVTFLQVTLIPLPGAITILAGNYLFGMLPAFLYSYIATLIGAMVTFWLGRWIGRPFVNFIAGSPEKVDEWMHKLRGRENVLLFFMFLLPFFPDDILCAVAGILPISGMGFFIMQLITRLTSAGATLVFMSGEFIPWHGWGLAVLALLGVLAIVAFVISYRNAERINRFLADVADRITAKLKHKK